MQRQITTFGSDAMRWRCALLLGWLILINGVLMAHSGGSHIAYATDSFVVNSTGDDSDWYPGDGDCAIDTALPATCTLRAAIEEANASVNPEGVPDQIHFAIPGVGLHTIQPLSALPAITDPVIIDGYTQPGASANTLAVGNNAVLQIELDGTNAGPGDGLALRTSNSIIRGLVINRFAGAGISVSEVNNQIEGNFIGTDPTGTLDRGNGSDGIFVANFTQPVGASNNTIGGATPAQRNLISANGNGTPGVPRNGITLDQVINTFIYGNYIGTDASGTAALGNYQTGIGIFRGATTMVGGSGAGQGNLISGNLVDGIGMSDTAQSGGHHIQGNQIGTNAQGDPTLGNGRHGISLVTPNVTIGGTNNGEGNVIAGNSQAGIAIGNGTGNALRGNAIYANGALGIDLGGDGVTFNHQGALTGPNNYQNYPVLTLATTDGANTRVQGTLQSTPNSTVDLDFFANPTCDPSYFGEGERFLGTVSVATDGSGKASFDTSFPTAVAEADGVSAVATDSSGNSSEFSYCRPASTANINWQAAQALPLNPVGGGLVGTTVQQRIMDRFQEKWFKFPVAPGDKVHIALTSLPGSAVSLHRDPLPFYNALINPTNAAVLSAEVADVTFLPSQSLPSQSLPSQSLPSQSLPTGALLTGFLPSQSLPSQSLPSQSLPSQSLPSQSLPSQSLPSQSLPSGILPAGSLPSQSLPSQSLPSQSLPSQSLPSQSLPEAYSGAARRSLIAISLDPYATVQTIDRNTYDLLEDLYIRVVAPFDPVNPFTLEVTVEGGVCGAIQTVPNSIPSPANHLPVRKRLYC
ncbi:MAG: CSLREA domain-containing protein [Caldilineaceae bacterium]